jgi:hypothetical protein
MTEIDRTAFPKPADDRVSGPLMPAGRMACGLGVAAAGGQRHGAVCVMLAQPSTIVVTRRCPHQHVRILSDKRGAFYKLLDILLDSLLGANEPGGGAGHDRFDEGR